MMTEEQELFDEVRAFEEMRAAGVHGKDADVIARNGHGLAWVQQASREDLMAMAGIGAAASKRVMAAVGRTTPTAVLAAPTAKARERSTPAADYDEGDDAAHPFAVEEARRRQARILTELKRDYSWDTVNDLANMVSLAALIAAREMIEEELTVALAASNVGAVAVLQKQHGDLTRHATALEKGLGIDAVARTKHDKTKRADEVLAEHIIASKEFRKEHIRHFQHCGVLLGFACVHFPKSFPRTLTIVCPRCGVEFEAELVTQKQLDLYLEAGDFIPDGAPMALLDGDLGAAA